MQASENVLSIIVCNLINKNTKFKSLKFKNPYLMNFKFGGRVVGNVELKKKKQNLPKVYSKPSQ